jgi:DNA-directed RNA polymerase specialized sigma24 family protein
MKMPRQAQGLNLSKKQRLLLTEVISERSGRIDHRFRAQIILLVDQGYSDHEIANELQIHQGTAGKWRRRWIAVEEKLLLWEIKQPLFCKFTTLFDFLHP